MTKLNCSVRGCSYQKDDRCVRGNIHIEGEHADKNSETCCGSFEQKRTCGCANSTCNCAPEMSEIACDACNCIYNENRKCSAEHIGVSGSNACAASETECASFRCC
ncbi:MAG: DUF1540 domain-containing protein [Roseburia sp.]